MKKLITHIKTKHLFFFGFVILFLSLIPTLLLGTDSIVHYHDQLDGEIIAYIYQAKYLFSDQDIIPEFLNGVGKTALTPPAPLAVLLFCVFSPFTAFSIMQLLGQTLAYIGMFFLINRITDNKYITFIIAILYTFLPFLPVYGLAQYGTPLLLICFHNLYCHKHKLASYLYVAFYTGMSSLVLIGFGWLLIGSVLTVLFLVQKRTRYHFPLLGAFLLMLVVYLAENLSLIAQILGLNNGFISHKEEYTLNSAPLFSQFSQYLQENSDHIPDYHACLLPVIIGTLLFAVLTFRRQSAQAQKYCKWLFWDALLLFLLYLLASFWSIAPIVAVREQFGALRSFQFSRVLWITPSLWYIALALCLKLTWMNRIHLKKLTHAFFLLLLVCLNFICLANLGFQWLKGSFVKPCVQELLLPDYETISWKDYFAPDVMEQVEDFLAASEGLTIDEYKVASLGIDPSAALYHGFYCIDGYSNNYPLEYKYAFREVIATELSKSDWLRLTYDTWGNRCYLFSAENGGYYNIEKGTFWYNTLELDTQALQELGCDYILSAAYIVPAADMNLTLLREEPFSTPDSYYNIYLYRIDIP